MAFYAYLNFGGNCRQAMTRYHEIFGGDLVLLPMSTLPKGDIPDGQADLIMHAALSIGDQLVMASDVGEGFTTVTGMYVNYSAKDVAEAERVWAGLSRGARIELPLAESFFAPRFGICVDEFGTPWMITAEPEQPIRLEGTERS